MTYKDWQVPILPKVQGTWNLHEALKSHQLDFFVLFSSWSGLRGQPGQANYAAANTFLDAFVQFRHNQGLPASVLDIGVMEDIGYVSRNSLVLEHFHSTATHVLHEQDLLDSLQVVMQRSAPTPVQASPNEFVNHSQLAIGLRSTLPLNDPNNRTSWKKDIRMAVYRNSETSGASTGVSDNEGLKQFLSTVSVNPSILNARSSVDFITNEIGMTLFSFMLRPAEELALEATMVALGVDSLVAIELRNWFRQKLGLDISVLEILGSASIAYLGEQATARLLEKHSEKASEEEPDPGNEKYLKMKAP
jgi:aryl carrier-like protein